MLFICWGCLPIAHELHWTRHWDCVNDVRAPGLSQVTAANCWESWCQAFPAVNNRPRQRTRGGNLWMRNNRRRREKTQLFNEHFCSEQMCSICQTSYGSLSVGSECVCVCKWTQTKCSGFMETEVGYTVWLRFTLHNKGSLSLSPTFSLPFPSTPLQSNCQPKLLSPSQYYYLSEPILLSHVAVWSHRVNVGGCFQLSSVTKFRSGLGQNLKLGSPEPT